MSADISDDHPHTSTPGLQPHPSSDHTQKPQLRVLVAEDDPINQQLMRMMIDRIGYYNEVVEDGEKVLEKLRAQPFDALLLDMHMPVMNGYEVLEEIRNDSRLSHIVVIAFTAGSMQGEENSFLQVGCDDYLPKPVEQSVLAEKLEKTRQGS